MKIIATQVKGKDLKSGELFSAADQFYWDNRPRNAIGEKVYIRTDAPCSKSQEDELIHRITIETGNKDE